MTAAPKGPTPPPEMTLDASKGLSPVRRALAAPLLFAIWLYKKLVSPLLPPACRFYPSCSVYGFTAISVHGPVRGTVLTTKRLLKCHPFHPGGYDPVPGTEPPAASGCGHEHAHDHAHDDAHGPAETAPGPGAPAR